MDMFEEYENDLKKIFQDVSQKVKHRNQFNDFKFVQYIHKSTCKNGPCELCSYNDFRLFDENFEKPPIGEDNHIFCDCYYRNVETLFEDDLVDYALYVVVECLREENKLPDYYITKKTAEDEYHWDRSRNTLAGKAPGKMLGGDVYENRKEKLPVKAGRTWRECDVGYQIGKRNGLRLYYSNDGLMFFSPDHGMSKFYFIKGA